MRIVPLFLQMPTFWEGNRSSITCSAFGSSKVSMLVNIDYCFWSHLKLLQEG